MTLTSMIPSWLLWSFYRLLFYMHKFIVYWQENLRQVHARAVEQNYIIILLHTPQPAPLPSMLPILHLQT